MKQIVFDRHAKRRMKERGVTEEEAEFALEHPDAVEPSMKGRLNSYKFVSGRYLRIAIGDVRPCESEDGLGTPRDHRSPYRQGFFGR